MLLVLIFYEIVIVFGKPDCKTQSSTQIKAYPHRENDENPDIHSGVNGGNRDIPSGEKQRKP